MMKKKVTTLVAASLAALTLLAGCGSNGTADKKDGAAKGDKTLIVGTEPTFPPFEFTENEKDVASTSTWPRPSAISWATRWKSRTSLRRPHPGPEEWPDRPHRRRHGCDR